MKKFILGIAAVAALATGASAMSINQDVGDLYVKEKCSSMGSMSWIYNADYSMCSNTKNVLTKLNPSGSTFQIGSFRIR